MDLNDLHNKLSKDATYVRAYEKLGDSVELALHCRAVREERGITQAELAAETDATTHAISRFEKLAGAEAWVISAIVHRLEPWLRQRGVKTDKWMHVSPKRPRHEAQQQPDITSTVRGLSTRPTSLPTSDRANVPKSGHA
jgi:DNA-binding XRE family transcriptional regulator